MADHPPHRISEICLAEEFEGALGTAEVALLYRAVMSPSVTRTRYILPLSDVSIQRRESEAAPQRRSRLVDNHQLVSKGQH
ncbi:MAG: hypothetical protein V3U52_03730 [Thermoplasmata archaeon]